jgi:hypothetical protein
MALSVVSRTAAIVVAKASAAIKLRRRSLSITHPSCTNRQRGIAKAGFDPRALGGIRSPQCGGKTAPTWANARTVPQMAENGIPDRSRMPAEKVDDPADKYFRLVLPHRTRRDFKTLGTMLQFEQISVPFDPIQFLVVDSGGRDEAARLCAFSRGLFKASRRYEARTGARCLDRKGEAIPVVCENGKLDWIAGASAACELTNTWSVRQRAVHVRSYWPGWLPLNCPQFRILSNWDFDLVPRHSDYDSLGVTG